MIQPKIRVPIHPCSSGRPSSFLSNSAGFRPRNSGPAPAGRGPQAKTSASAVESVGPVVLGNVAPGLVSVGRGSGGGETGDGGRLASGRISILLEMAVTRVWRKTPNHG